jgi:ssDNA-binding Zn-finger/Zn-ribbon topoisomerase 1
MLKRRQTHGKWCTLRSYETECPKCGKKVLYWECEHGCKVFFDLPATRPMTKHVCYRKTYREYKIELDSLVDDTYEFKEDYSCSVCGKIFKNEKALRNHVKSLKNRDDEHAEFFANTYFGK